jgi:hypothetical protein
MPDLNALAPGYDGQLLIAGDGNDAGGDRRVNLRGWGAPWCVPASLFDELLCVQTFQMRDRTLSGLLCK